MTPSAKLTISASQTKWGIGFALIAFSVVTVASAGPPPSDRAAPGPPNTPTRVAQLRDLHTPPESYMLVVAYRKKSEVDRWGGPIDLRVSEPTLHVATRASGRWQWAPKLSKPPRLNIPTREGDVGGQLVTRWAEEQKADEVKVVVVPYLGEADDDASRTGAGAHGQGQGTDLETEHAGEARPVVQPTEEAAGLEAEPETAVHVAASDESSSGLADDGEGATSGDAHDASPDARGSGTYADGRAGGSALGSDTPSWVDNPRAEIDIRGGRTPADGGRAGGSAGGEAGGKGHVGGAGWLNVLEVPEVVAPAVAAAMIVFEADVAGFGQRLFSRTVRGLAKKEITSEIGDQAKALVRRRTQDARARMQQAKPAAPPAEHIDEIMDYVPEEVELAFYRDLAGLAKRRANINRSVAANTADATDDVSKYVHQVATENHGAWRKIEEVCEERMQGVRSTAAPATSVRQPAGVGGSTSGTPSAPTSTTPGTAPGSSVRTPTTVSTPAHTIGRKGGLGPVLVGLRGEAKVRAVHNIGPRKLIVFRGRIRVPDGVTDHVLTEVKNVKKLSFTKQLKDYLAISQEHGLRFDLFVRPDTQLSGPLEELIKAKTIRLRRIP